MRRALTFTCKGDALVGTLDEGAGPTGVLIVSGGNEIRIGAHRGMAELAAALAERDVPAFRFDRRGVGDSEGTNNGFRSSEADITAALAAFRSAAPSVQRVVAFGNCDAATALILHTPQVDALVLANPWHDEPVDDLPPPAAIKSHYARRLRDPAAWAALLSGKVNLSGLAKGLGRVAAPPRAPLSGTVAEALAQVAVPTTILLADRDNTAVTFEAAWQGSSFAAARHSGVTLRRYPSASHSFASNDDFAVLIEALVERLSA